MTENLVIIGNGMAPGPDAGAPARAAPGRYQVTIFNAEPRVNYDRIMLSPVLSGEKAFEDIVIHGDGWYIEHGITLYKGHKIVAIDREAKTVTSDHGVTEPLRQARHRHRLGAVHHPGAGQGPARRAHLPRPRRRQRHAARGAVARPRRSSSAAACSASRPRPGLKERGMDVTVLHVMPTLMERQLDPGRRLPAAEGGRGARHQGHHQGQHQGDRRQRQGRGRRARRRHDHPGDARRHGGRHPAQRRRSPRTPGSRSIAASSSTTGMRPPTPTSSPSANAPRSAARSTASSRRSTRWRASRRRSLRGRRGQALRPFRHADQAQGHRHRPLLARRLRRRRRPRGDRAARRLGRRLQARSSCKDNRIIGTVLLRRDRRRRLVQRPQEEGDRHLGDARHADLRAGLPGRRPAGPFGGRCGTGG